MPSNVGAQVGESEITPAKILGYQLDLIWTTGSQLQSYGAPNLHLLPHSLRRHQFAAAKRFD
jgi:hypothetical protein